MENLKVATLIEALGLVGQVYRTKDGSQPADPVKKVLQQLSGAGDMALAEWARTKRAKPKTVPKKAEREPKPVAANADQALATLGMAKTQDALHDAVAAIALSAGQWISLAKQLTGQSAKSGKTAREAVETHFSDRLLLDERIRGVRRQFG